jgi:hypothetical protein
LWIFDFRISICDCGLGQSRSAKQTNDCKDDELNEVDAHLGMFDEEAGRKKDRGEDGGNQDGATAGGLAAIFTQCACAETEKTIEIRLHRFYGSWLNRLITFTAAQTTTTAAPAITANPGASS